MVLIEPFIILAALLCGIASRAIGFPALIGYLIAGFVLHEFEMSGGPVLEMLAELGITLLLFTIGLKLEPFKLLELKVWGTTLVYMTVTQVVMFLLLITLSAALPSLAPRTSARGRCTACRASRFSRPRRRDSSSVARPTQEQEE